MVSTWVQNCLTFRLQFPDLRTFSPTDVTPHPLQIPLVTLGVTRAHTDTGSKRGQGLGILTPAQKDSQKKNNKILRKIVLPDSRWNQPRRKIFSRPSAAHVHVSSSCETCAPPRPPSRWSGVFPNSEPRRHPEPPRCTLFYAWNPLLGLP